MHVLSRPGSPAGTSPSWWVTGFTFQNLRLGIWRFRVSACRPGCRERGGRARPGSGRGQGSRRDAEPYRLRAVAHSLGASSLLVYAVMCRRRDRPHHLSRIILLTPAGFLDKLPLVRRQGPCNSAYLHTLAGWFCRLRACLTNSERAAAHVQ